MGKDMTIKHSVYSSPAKCVRTFLKKLSMGNKPFLGKFMGSLCTGRLLIKSYHHYGGRESFTNAFPSNLSTVNLKIFLGHGGRHARKQVLTSLQNYEVNGSEVSKFDSSPVSLFLTLAWGIHILFEKSTKSLGLRNSCKACLLFKYFQWWLDYSTRSFWELSGKK